MKKSEGSALARAFLLGLVFLFSWSYRVYKSVTPSPDHLPFSWSDDTGYFWTESAFQYRYARVAAEGRALPVVDRQAQYPEGLILPKEMTALMEPLCGWGYRLFIPKSVPLHFFALIFSSGVSALAVFPVFFLAQRLTGSPAWSLGAALYYALCPASFERGIGAFEYESFSLPMFFLALPFYYRALSERRATARGLSCAAAASFLLLSLVSWHFAPFLIFVFFAVQAALLLASPDAAAGEALAVIGALVLAGCWLIPGLRARGLLYSWLSAAIFGYGLCFALKKYLRFRSTWVMVTLYALCVSSLAALLHQLNPERGLYEHVFELAASKLRFLLVKPADPSLIPAQARAIWVAPNNSPEVSIFLWLFLPGLLVPIYAGLAAVFRRSKPARSVPAAASLWILGLVSLFLYIAIDRLSVVFVFFLAVLLAYSCFLLSRSRARWPKILFLALLLLESWKTCSFDKFTPEKAWLKRLFPLRALERPNLDFSDLMGVIAWVKENTAPDSPILAAFETSPDFLTYADRPIILHPKWENPRLRARFAEFLNALYGSEEQLRAFCLKYGARYFVYQADFFLSTTSDSYRYRADRLLLSPDSAAAKFHFPPEKLRWFELVYQNSSFRVYRVRH